MRFALLTLFAWLVCWSQPGWAQHWATSDKLVTVIVPDPATFHEVVPTPQPFAVLWANADDSVKLGVVSTTKPANVKINLEELKEGFRQETKGTVTGHEAKYPAGYTVYKVTAKTDTYELHQEVYAEGTAVHKVMAVVQNGADQKVSSRFLSEIGINPPTTPSLDTHQLSKLLGAGGFLILIIAVSIALALRRSKAV